MPSTGYIQVRAYTSTAQFPLENVAITITTPDDTAIAMRLTDRNGQIPAIAIPVPDKQESLSPDPPENPFTTVTLYAHLKGYERAEYENVQIFSDTTTYQNIELVPLAELPAQWDQTVIFNTPPQNL